jgi:hypothetical protein
MEMSGQLHAPASLPLGKEPLVAVGQEGGRAGGPQSRSGRCGEEKNPQPLPELKPPIILPVVQRYNTELSRIFLYSYFPKKFSYLFPFAFYMYSPSS